MYFCTYQTDTEDIVKEYTIYSGELPTFQVLALVEPTENNRLGLRFLLPCITPDLNRVHPRKKARPRVYHTQATGH
jgi:hypothetical protein